MKEAQNMFDQQVEVLTISQTKNGALLGNVEVIPDPTLKHGERIILGWRIFISKDDFLKIKKMKRARTMLRFIARLRESVKNRPIVKPKIVLDESVPNRSS